jgi:hypothetical protein
MTTEKKKLPKVIRKKGMRRGDYYYKEEDGRILPYGNFNCEGGYNHISFFQSKDMANRVKHWQSRGDFSAGYQGEVGEIQVRLYPESRRSHGRYARLRVIDISTGEKLAVYQNPETDEKFLKIHQIHESRQESAKQEVTARSVRRVEEILASRVV